MPETWAEKVRRIAETPEPEPRAPCVHATPGKKVKTGCGRCRQQWICSFAKARGGMPRGGWPEAHCRRACKHNPARNTGGPDVPLEDVPALREVMRLVLKGRVLSGDSPRYQDVNPVDLTDAAAKLKARFSHEELEELWLQAAQKWTMLGEEDGGHPIETVEAKLRELARALGVEEQVERLEAGLP